MYKVNNRFNFKIKLKNRDEFLKLDLKKLEIFLNIMCSLEHTVVVGNLTQTEYLGFLGPKNGELPVNSLLQFQHKFIYF